MREACTQGRIWHEQGMQDLSMSVNVSAVQFAQPRLLETVERRWKTPAFRQRSWCWKSPNPF
jgi:EAL domain-containing protein (putative c-di-GMP-specific phosphodiesterase class I)